MEGSIISLHGIAWDCGIQEFHLSIAQQLVSPFLLFKQMGRDDMW
jgi:hypothetical protein